MACSGGDPAPTATTSPPAATAAPSATPAPATETEASPRTEAAAPLDEIDLAFERVVELSEPIAMAVRAGDDALYIAERGGTVRAVRGGEVEGDPVLDISGEVSTGGERGLLGIAFSADGDELFASYTDGSGDSVLDAFPMDGDTAQVDGRRELLSVGQPYPNHNGGNIALGPDRMLYLGLGDGGAGGDPHANGQDRQELLGKMLRLDPADGSAPDDNPFTDDPDTLPEIYALGLRNPWRFSFDRRSGDLWVADVGQNTVEEVNVTPADDSAGRNYGWNIFEGSQPYKDDEQPEGAVVPVVEYPTGEEGCAVTGGYVYRGDAIPDLRGAYLYSDFCGGWLKGIRMKGGKVADSADFGVELAEVASFGEDADGELYVLSLGGAVERIVAADQ